MRQLEQDAPAASPHQDALTLPFELRQKSRLRTKLDSGEEVAVLMPRGRVLRDGDRLRANDGGVVLVQAAPEQVSTVSATDPSALARAAYHLGNRHVPVQIGNGFLRYQHDHVLDDLVRTLGLSVRVETAPFEPEAGAYRHTHAHSHDPSHGDDHEHDHGHE
jgi:urease accessory protein